MTNEDKQRIAIAQLDQHTQRYSTPIHERVRKLWASGEIFNYDLMCLPPDTKFVMDTQSMRLSVVPPSWEAHYTIGDYSPDHLEPGGQWEHARSFLPLFEVVGSMVVARIDHPECPIALYEDEMWKSTIDGFQDGVWPLAPSLDVFLKSLVSLDTPDVDIIPNEDLWVEPEADA
jgi:hypothetical protein